MISFGVCANMYDVIYKTGRSKHIAMRLPPYQDLATATGDMRKNAAKIGCVFRRCGRGQTNRQTRSLQYFTFLSGARNNNNLIYNAHSIWSKSYSLSLSSKLIYATSVYGCKLSQCITHGAGESSEQHNGRKVQGQAITKCAVKSTHTRHPAAVYKIWLSPATGASNSSSAELGSVDGRYFTPDRRLQSLDAREQ